MKKIKFNWFFWFLSVLVGFILVFAPKMAYELFTNQVQDENGLMDPIVSLILAIIISFIWIVYVFSGITMLRLATKNKFCCLELTEKGIENTAVFVNLFALIIILPVRCIPWEAVKSYESEPIGLSLSVDTNRVDAGFIAKLILKFSGYRFCHGMVKPKVTDEDLEPYKHKFSKSDNVL